MKKKTTEIATNTSSGAEKVEKIQKEVKTAPSNKQNQTAEKAKTIKKENIEQPSANTKRTAKGEAALGNAEKDKNTSQKAENLAKKEASAAKSRVEAALSRKELQEKRRAERIKRLAERKESAEKRLAERKARAEKRLAERKASAEKRLAERKARAEKRKAAHEAMIRERAHEKANRNQAHSKKKAERAKKMQQKRENHNHDDRNKGYGGWLAAVIALGSVTLALTTAVTVGAVEMNRTKKGMMSAYRGTMYEMTGIMEHVDDDLERARISASPAQQSRILTDLLVQARLAEADLERLPISAEEDSNITVFLNRTAAECERMLQKLRHGEVLMEEDFQTLERLYQTNHSIRAELDGLMESMTDKDLAQYIKDGAGSIGDALKRLEEMTLEENRAMFEDAKNKIQEKFKDKKAWKGEDMEKNAKKERPEMEDPSAMPKIEPTEAEEICQRYFSDYNIAEFQCIGETNSRKIKAYNVQGYDEKGTLLFAEIRQTDGALMKFDYYEDCQSETFDIHNAERIAEEFLEKMGYDDMEAVRYKENGTMTDFTFVYEDDGVAYYPDEVRVKVCRSRGVITGFDASKYMQNHKNRDEVSPKITLAEAQNKLHKNLTVESSRLAVAQVGRREKTVYEFLCSYDKELYFVYVDGNTGEEISIINARTV